MEFLAWYDPEVDVPVVVRSASDLDRVIDVVKYDDGPTLIQLNALDPRDGLLVIGVFASKNRGTLLYRGPQGMWFSKGIAPYPGETLLYRYLDAEVDYPSDAEIPLHQVVKAAHDYLVDARLPAGPTWQPPPTWYPA
ncbi:hypothetical protein GCM10022243_06710 [Saccharothrix violaceirubra]